MTTDQLRGELVQFLRDTPMNYLDPENALREELVGLRLFDDPLLAVGDAADPLFPALRQPGALHPAALLPGDWLPGAVRVASVFCPFSERVRRGVWPDARHPSDEWVHGRIEGQKAVEALGAFMAARLTECGYQALAPALDPRAGKLLPTVNNWSERHVGYICGLGTFGLSKSIITQRGAAGRLISVVTTCPLEVTPRRYTGLYDNCILCGKCQQNCPAGAIDGAKGLGAAKDDPVCSAFLKTTRRPPRGSAGTVYYGCGRCQLDVPCECRDPAGQNT